MAVVYWIHLPEHTDIASRGYVGISKTTAKTRFKSHRSSANRGSDLTVHRAIRKYGNRIVIKTLLEGSEEYCLMIENRLRPVPEIGWNICSGGKATRTGTKHSAATRSAMSAGRKAVGLSTQRIESMRAARTYEHREAQKDWNNPRSNRLVWNSAEELYALFAALPKCGHKRLARISGKFTSDNLETITAKFNSGWIPSQDSDYVKWKATNG
jgi:hypothetical protein